MFKEIYIAMSSSTVVLALICCTTLAFWWYSSRRKNLPPGPIGLPYLGSLIDYFRHVKAGKLIEYLSKLHEKYGPVTSIKAGAQRVIFINDGKLLNDLFKTPTFSDRPHDTIHAMKIMSLGSPRGIFFGNGEGHDEMRRFALLTLRDLGVGKNTLDEMIQTEASVIGQHFEEVADSEDQIMHDIVLKMQVAIANTMHHIVFGFRYDHDDPVWVKLMKNLDELTDINPLSFPTNYIPFLEKIPPLNRYVSNNIVQRYYYLNGSAARYLGEQIDLHRAAYTDGEIKDFIDQYLKYESEQKEHYTTENVFAVMLDLFKAGTATVGVTFTWATICLVKYPEIQKTIQEEIDRVFGSRQFDRRDKEKLPKTCAFLNEVHRYASIAPMSAPHTVTHPVEANGYKLLPGDLVFGSLYLLNHDKGYWKDPEEFRISRWLNDKGELIKHNHFYCPFSFGKRACPGKQFANIELILMLVHLVQNFTFESLKGGNDKIELTEGFLRIPQGFSFRVIRRK